MKAVVGHRHRLGKSLCFVVDAPRSDRIDVTPIILILGVHQRVAVTFRSGCEKKLCTLILRQSERIVSPQCADLQRGNWMFQIVDWTRRGRKMEHKVHGVGNKYEL